MIFRLGMLRFRLKELKEDVAGGNSKSISLFEYSQCIESEDLSCSFSTPVNACRICFGTH